LNYGYNLTGRLTSIADAADSSRTVSYVYDKAGSLKDVNGAGFGGVSNYLTNINYRAFGSVKAANYGSGKSLSLSYNNRLQASNYTVSQTANTNNED
jgi:hypothetical protein